MQGGHRQGKKNCWVVQQNQSPDGKCEGVGQKASTSSSAQAEPFAPLFLNNHLERSHYTRPPPHRGWLGLSLAHMVPLCRRLKDALSKHPFFQDDMAPFQSTGLAERSVGCISAPTHFLCQAPLYYAQVHTQRCRPWNSPILSLNCHIRGHLLLQSLNPPAAGMYQFFPARWEISKSLSHGRPFKHRHYFCAPPQSSHGTELPPWKEIQTAPKPRTNTVSLKARLQQSYHKGTGNTRKNSTDRDHDKFINTLKEAVKT